MPSRKILIVHPNDNSTLFLNRIKNHLILEFPDEVDHYNIYPNTRSHELCLERISNHSEHGLIIFLGHGRSDSLAGACGRRVGTLASLDAIAMNPDDYFYLGNFITKDNVEVFANKKVFCLACRSNEDISNYALEKGAKSFFGFGNIPTSMEEFKADGISASNDLVKEMKTAVTGIIRTTLFLGLKKEMDFDDLLNYFKFVTNQTLTDILIHKTHFKERYILGDYLYDFKKSAKVSGDRKIKLADV